MTNQEKSQIGAVLVVGGGIAGLQSSLALANSGFKVYLIEEKPSIGGVMAQLDKTFPTNDCSMCILSPKLVECAHHPNIELITKAEILGIKGKAGRFKVSLKKKAKYVNENLCTACGECIDVCPVNVKNEFNEGISNRKAIFIQFPQAVPLAYSIEKRGIAPCTNSCPAGINVQGYVALISAGKFKEAYELIKEKCPLPGVIGRICPHPCEESCNRKEIDEPIAICTLKRASFDYGFEEKELLKSESLNKKIAIIGSGPSGLTVAYKLAKKGYNVTIFEKEKVAGGMLSLAIPKYRLPKEILKKEIDEIKKLGVEIKLNTKIGEHITIDELFKNGYKAIFIGIGAHKSRKLGIEGENLKGVIQGIEFLRDVNLKNNVKIGKKVAVIGGGDVAIDSARSALRFGSKPIILYRRTKREMPARKEEVLDAINEGVKIYYLVMPKRIIGKNGKVNAIECIKMKLREKDKSGRRRAVPIKNSEFIIDVDTVITAIGQYPNISLISKKIKTSKNDTILVDKDNCATNLKGVFAGGDCVSTSIAIDAIAWGNRAAMVIEKYLKNGIWEEIKENRKIVKIDDIDIENIEIKTREKQEILKVEERVNNFNEIEKGFTKEMAIEEGKRCLNCGICSECMLCLAVCKRECIFHEEKDEVMEIDVGTIILSPGMEKFDAKLKKEYGYSRYKNVITSMEFERLLSASGPFHGHILRPSDKRIPKSIAFIQCVGSRDNTSEKNYCSAVCCTYATKQAVIAKEHLKNVEIYIFYIDMRTFGKGFQEYYNKAKNDYDVKYIRCRVSHVEEIPNSKNLKIKYEIEDGNLKEKEFDLVVLSVGLKPTDRFIKLGKKFGIEINKYGFCKTSIISPLETNKRGIFVAGTFQAPKDIPDSVAQGLGASIKAQTLIANERGKLVKKREYPIEKDIGKKPRIGVFVCHCGINISSVVNVQEVVEYAKKLENVVYCEDNLYTCSQDTQERIKKIIEEYNLNRVVVASCTPTSHEHIFQNTIREAGLNPYLFDLASLREHCSWVHQNEPEKATKKAKKIVEMSVVKVRLNRPVHKTKVKITPSCLVIGGGIAGMTSALDIANQGFEVYLLEKEANLGGNLLKIQYLLGNENPKEILKETLDKVLKNKKIKVYKNSRLLGFRGYIGNFKATILQENKIKELNFGSVVVAIGGEEYKPKEFLYGKDKRIVTQLELEKIIADGKFQANNIVMIQCVGSRNWEREYCSRTCCAEAIKNALKIKNLNPKADIFILHKDIRTYGFREEYYNIAREKGVFFINYDDENNIEVKKESGVLKVFVNDKILKRRLLIKPELLVLSGATIPTKENEKIAKLLRIPLDKNKFFLEAHMKIKPVDFTSDGIFLCGNAHSPKFLDETISQASATASRVSEILSKEGIEVEGIPVLIDIENCTGCGLCELNCPNSAIKVNKRTNKAEITEILCKGCGICLNVCHSFVPNLRQFEGKQIFSMIEVTI